MNGDWDAIASAALLELVDSELVVVWSEVEAKLADRRWPTAPKAINPHRLTRARQLLLGAELDSTSAPTRGGRVIEVFHRTGQRLRRRALEDAAARKRILQARYLSWAVTRNHVGSAGEKVQRMSLRDVAGTAGYVLESPAGVADIRLLFGQPIPGGPIDDAAYFVSREPSPIAITVPIEVKNIRDWVYPSSPKLSSFLYKAAQLQIQNPDTRFCPVFVCRRAHITTFWLADTFGFYVADAKAQFISPSVEEDLVVEIRNALGYDLLRSHDPHPLLRHHFAQGLPARIRDMSEKWSSYGVEFADHFLELRDESIDESFRQGLLYDFWAAIREIRTPQDWAQEGFEYMPDDSMP